MAWKFMLATALGMAAKTTMPLVAAPPARPLVAAGLGDIPMESCPINPDWVLSGNPEARMGLHSAAYDDQATTAVWDCTAGTFRWYFGWDETVMILEGEVHVTTEDGNERTLRAGDIAYFAGKTWATWHIDTYLRKIAFCRKPLPKSLAVAYRVRDLLRGPVQRGGLAA